MFDVIGAEFLLGARPAQWQTASDLTAELDADSASAVWAGEAANAGENRASVAADSVVECAADSGPTDGGGLFGQAVPQHRRELDPALVNGLLLRARNLPAWCQFQEVSQLLWTMSEGRKSTEITSVLTESLDLANLQAAACEAFGRAGF